MKNNQYNNIAFVLKAGGHPVRIQIIELLKSKGEVSVQELSKATDTEQSLTSHHLSLLVRAGYLTSKRKGKFIFYSIASKELYNLIEIVSHYIALKK